MRNIKHYIWDFDGTLFDTYPFIVACFNSMLRECGIDEDEGEVRRRLMLSLSDSFAHYQAKHGLGEEFYLRYTEYMDAESVKTSPPYPFAVESCCLISDCGRNNYLYTHRGESTHTLLRASGLTPYFTQVVTSLDSFRHKPDPEAITYLIKKYEMKNKEVLMIGDREIDILCGANAGINTCFITNGKPNGSVHADYTFESLEEFHLKIQDSFR